MGNVLADFRKRVLNGEDFPGKGSFDSFDACDYLKRLVCDFFVAQIKSGETIDSIVQKISGSTPIEIRAAIKFRTERLTLERLMEMKDIHSSDSKLESFKNSLSKTISLDKNFPLIKINEQIRRMIKSGSVSDIPIDTLVNLTERLEIDLKTLLP